MRFVADVHIHSRYSRATSRELSPENLYAWSALKGITVVGTGDFTHPAWLAELGEKLEPAEEGLYRLRPAWREPEDRALPERCRGNVRFVLSVEISSIYKKGDRTRKVHNVVLLPDLEAAASLNQRLGAIGNLGSDGRPILGLDCHHLLETCLEVCPEVLFIPAHIWTPHFAVLGASSGFDSLEECFEDLLPHIFAVETGLSSDPPMNWRLSDLDPFAIVSNSDAHSPPKLGREATCFDTELSYPALLAALRQRDERFTGTLEFYPEEGKYHYDGHRKCQVRWTPAQTLAAEGLCPVCGRKLTVGVLHRVERLADRPEGTRPDGARSVEYLIPLAEVIGSALGVGPGSKKVQGIYRGLLEELGPELHILRTVPIAEIAGRGQALVAEGVRRMRAGEVEILAGYDGEFGTVRVFSPDEQARLTGQEQLFDLPVPEAPSPPTERRAIPGPRPELPLVRVQAEKGALDAAQRCAVEAEGGPVVVVAGPGSGKTRALTHRVAYLVRERGVRPGQILAVTFTNRAAGEMRERLEELLEGVTGLQDLRVGTFHRVALEFLHAWGRGPDRTVLDALEARGVLTAVLDDLGLELGPGPTGDSISLAKAAGRRPHELEDGELGAAYAAYQDRLQAYGARDFDDILLDLLDLLEGDPQILAEIRDRFPHLLVDEFQDVNAVQYRLVRLLAGSGAGLFAIGDPDQAIYGFRGADPGYFAQLRQDYPAARRIHLGTNYRSADTIVDAAAALVGHGVGSAGRPRRGPRIRLLSVPGEIAEGIAVVRHISRMVGGADMLQADRHEGGDSAALSPGEIGVLFRTGRQADVLEECFLQEGLPYRLRGQKGFLESESVRQALAFCRFAQQPDEGLRLLRALELPPFNPGGAGLRDVRQHLEQAATPAEGLHRRAGEKLRQLRGAAERYRRLAAAEGAGGFLRRWQEEYGPAGDPDLDRLIQVADTASSLGQLLDTVLLGLEADFDRAGGRGPPPAEAVQLLTLHAAKGLEFAAVFICGVEDGLIPFRDRECDLAEERRLFYVGMTRAREELVLVRARNRVRRGRPLQPEVSPFVRELPPELIEEEQVELPRRRERAEQLSLF